MKRVIFCLSVALSLFFVSCQKDNGALPDSTWQVQGKNYTATKVIVSSSSDFISGSDGMGSSIDFTFKKLPTLNGDFTVNDAAYTIGDVAIRTVLGGNVVYNSYPDNGAFVTVRIEEGKYKVIMNNVKMANSGVVKDTVSVSVNLSEQ